MYVSSLSVEHFGPWSDLAIPSLAEGLHVVVGPPGSGKATVVSFLRAMLGGFDATTREQFRIHASRGCGGSVTVQTAAGRHTISRYDDGSREGRLTVQRPDGAVIGWRHLHDLLGDFPLALLGKAYVVDFARRVDLNDLLIEAAACGLPVVAAEYRQPQLDLEAEIAARKEQLTALQRQISTLERALSGLGQPERLADKPVATTDQSARPTEADAPERLAGKLRVMDRRLRCWKKTLRDIVVRKQRKSEEVERLALAGPPAAASLAQPRRILRSLEQRVQAIQRTVERMGPQLKQHCQCQTLHTTITVSLRELSQEIYEACNALNHWQARDQHRHVAEERDQLARCEIELRKSIRALHRRREALLDQLAASRPRFALHPDHGRYCHCADHPSAAAGGTVRESGHPALAKDEASRLETHRVASERLRRLAELAQLQAEIAELESRRAPTSAPLQPLAHLASEHLRRFSAEQWRKLHGEMNSGGVPGYQIFVEDAAGRTHAERDLPKGVRDQVFLAFCLAVVEAGERRGWRLPLVINGAFAEFPARHMDGVLATLRDFARHRQVVCLTRYEHVASVARQLHVAVHSLVDLARPAATYSAAVRTARADASAEVLAHPFSLVEGAFLLHEQDPIERSPSLDEASAVRLRKAGLSRVGDLLRIAPHELAVELRGWDITAERLESWQAQARLMCQLHGLRPYDARILVACGIRSPEQLERLQPGALRARVRELASTSHGQGIMLSGTEAELARVTDWIHAPADTLVRPITDSAAGEDLVEGDVQYRTYQRASARQAARREEAAEMPPPQRSAKTRKTRSAGKWRGATAEPRGESGTEAAEVESLQASAALSPVLHPSDPLDRAPFVGPAMARRLQAAGLHTLADLLEADPRQVSAQLAQRRIDPDVVRRWQGQGELACHLPGLTPQHAQFLIARGIRSLADLARTTPAELLAGYSSGSAAAEGKRNGRGTKPPEADQIAQWILIAQQARSAQAA